MIIILALNHYNNKNNNYHRDHNSRPPHRQTVPRQQQDEELCDHRSRKVTCPSPDKTRFFTVFVNIVLYCHSYMTDVVVLILAPQIQIVPVESSHCRFVGFVFGFSSLSVSLCFVFVYVFSFCLCFVVVTVVLIPDLQIVPVEGSHVAGHRGKEKGHHGQPLHLESLQI